MAWSPLPRRSDEGCSGAASPIQARDSVDAPLTNCQGFDTFARGTRPYDRGVIVRVLTARVALHNAGRFEDLLRQQLPRMREHKGLVYVKLARQANGAFEEVILFEEWRDAASLYAWTGGQLSRPRLMPGAEVLAEDVRVTHYEALDVDPDSLMAVPSATRRGDDAP